MCIFSTHQLVTPVPVRPLLMCSTAHPLSPRCSPTNRLRIINHHARLDFFNASRKNPCFDFCLIRIVFVVPISRMRANLKATFYNPNPIPVKSKTAMTPLNGNCLSNDISCRDITIEWHLLTIFVNDTYDTSRRELSISWYPSTRSLFLMTPLDGIDLSNDIGRREAVLLAIPVDDTCLSNDTSFTWHQDHHRLWNKLITWGRRSVGTLPHIHMHTHINAFPRNPTTWPRVGAIYLGRGWGVSIIS